MVPVGLWEIIKGEQPGIIKTLLNYENAGQFGEFSIDFALTNHNLNGDFVVLKNVYLPWKGKTTEIDLLMIHEKGIFVFESKNYSGWIFGDAEQLNWTQVLESGQKNHFYNPIRQNRTHIMALAAYLNKPVSAFASYIVFSNRCTLKKVPANTAETIIVHRLNMLKVLRTHLKSARPLYSHAEIQDMDAQLKTLTNKSDAEKQQHIVDLETKCPFCGGKLVLRNGKHGQFWGCSTYPKCRFTRPIK